MKVIITESQYNLLIENKKNQLLFDTIKDEGWESASEWVGGIENLKGVLNIKTPMNFLNLFNNLDIVHSEDQPNFILFKYKNGDNIMIYDRENNYVNISYYVIWEFLKEGFELKYFEIQQIIEKWLSKAYNLKGVKIREIIDPQDY